MSASLYYPTFVETDATPAEWHEWLVSLPHSEEPSELISITDVCASAKCRATLRDVAGFVCGHVDADGSYRLTG